MRVCNTKQRGRTLAAVLRDHPERLNGTKLSVCSMSIEEIGPVEQVECVKVRQQPGQNLLHGELGSQLPADPHHWPLFVMMKQLTSRAGPDWEELVAKLKVSSLQSVAVLDRFLTCCRHCTSAPIA